MQEIYKVLGRPAFLSFLFRNDAPHTVQSNGMLLIVFTTGLQFVVFQLLMLASGKEIPAFMVPVNMLIGFGSIYFSKRGDRIFAKNYLLYGLAGMVTFYTLRFGLYSGTLVYFVPLAVCSLLVFRSRQKRYLLSFLTALVILLILLVVYDMFVGKSQYTPYLFFLGISVHVTGLILWMVFQSKRAYELSERQLKQVLIKKDEMHEAAIQHENDLEQKVRQLTALNIALLKIDTQLKHSELSLKALMDNLDLSICTVNTKFKLTAMNTHFADDYGTLFGYSPKLGDEFMSEKISKDSMYKWQELFERAFDGEHVKEELVTEVDKSLYLNIYPIVAEQGEVIGATLKMRMG